MKRRLIDPFVIALLAAVGAAHFLPYPGIKESPFHLDEIADIGVSIIFLLYGLQLGPEKLRTGVTHIRLHLLIHSSTFIIFPLFLILLKPLFITSFLQQVWLPFFFLAALPSTVSSSVIMVSIAGGNIPAAIFNATLSSLFGVFITPMWMSIFLQQASGDIDLGHVIGKLLLQVLLPLVIGLMLHKLLGKYAAGHRKRLKLLDQSVILLIVYCSFSESFYRGVFLGFRPVYLLAMFAMVVALLLIVYGTISVLAKVLRLNREDRITATFCGSKKSLVHGSVMAKVLFVSSANTGLVLLPLMLFHAVQLFIISIIAGRMRQHAQSIIS